MLAGSQTGTPANGAIQSQSTSGRAEATLVMSNVSSGQAPGSELSLDLANVASLATSRRADYMHLEMCFNGKTHSLLDSAYGMPVFLTMTEGVHAY